jgi:hypothetical protein
MTTAVWSGTVFTTSDCVVGAPRTRRSPPTTIALPASESGTGVMVGKGVGGAGAVVAVGSGEAVGVGSGSPPEQAAQPRAIHINKRAARTPTIVRA